MFVNSTHCLQFQVLRYQRVWLLMGRQWQPRLLPNSEFVRFHFYPGRPGPCNHTNTLVTARPGPSAER
jgi:hypothetical protein